MKDDDLTYNPDPTFRPPSTGGIDARERRRGMWPADLDLQAVTTIDADDLDQELADIAPNLAYWGLMLNHAKAEHRAARGRREATRGDLDEVFRGELQATRSTRVTDKEVMSFVERDDEYRLAQAAVAATERRVNDLTVVCEAIRVKSEALRSLCANIRAEKAALGGVT